MFVFSILPVVAMTWSQIGWGAVATFLIYGLGVLSAFDAVWRTRTPQGATAWTLALIFLPFVAVPAYWIFGRTKFEDYIETRREFNRKVDTELEDLRGGALEKFIVKPEDECDERTAGEMQAFKELATVPFTCGNRGKLLVDGKQTFDAIFAAIDAAEDYVLAQFYIIHDDELGKRFQQKLLDASHRGVRVYLLTDGVGSFKLPNSYMEELEEAGARTGSFGGTQTWIKQFRLNFRNHRKIVVVDGKIGFVGGLNVGDEYMGRDESIGPWRDTHLEVEGPVVQGLQYSFVRDWYYDCEEIPEVRWELAPAKDDKCALILASGPADKTETCGLLYTHAIESAEKRVWLASPYFVPDGRVLGALQLAALRGVDVRVIMPRKSDSMLFKWVPYSYLPEAERAGVKVYLYEEGFMHQKVILVDDDYAAVGTANFDNRSFRLNFEVTCLFQDDEFCADVEKMLEKDLERSTRLTRDDLEDRSFWFKLAARATRLLAPIL